MNCALMGEAQDASEGALWESCQEWVRAEQRCEGARSGGPAQREGRKSGGEQELSGFKTQSCEALHPKLAKNPRSGKAFYHLHFQNQSRGSPISLGCNKGKVEEGPKEAERVGQATRAPRTLAAREGTMFCSLSRVCRANRIKPLLQYSQGGD